MKRIYLDTAAATPLDRQVAKAMEPFERQVYGNPSSLHAEGVLARAGLEQARARVAKLLGAMPDEIVFTSGGTEANNLALSAAAGGAVIVSAIEHASVLAPATNIGEVLIAPVLSSGQLDLKKFSQLLSPEVKLVSVMMANNEIGAIQPIAEVAKIIRRQRKRFNTPYPYFHTDACQAGRFLSLDVRKLGVDLMTINGGKLYGPKGTGLLFVRRGVVLPSPLLTGGGQEQDRRAGTENVAGIAGLAAALGLAERLRNKEAARLTKLRDWLWAEIKVAVPEVELNGDLANRLPHNLNLHFPEVLAEQLVLELDAKGFAVSTGSACAIPKHNDSYVIMALGYSRARSGSSVRISLGRETTRRDLIKLIKVLPPIINKLIKSNHAYAADLTI